MEISANRAVMKYLFLKKKAYDDNKLELTKAYDDSAPSLSTIEN